MQAWVIEGEVRAIWTSGYLYPLANAVHLLVLVVIAPFVEEVFFRGLLFSAWIPRFGARWAAIWASLVFAVLHVDIPGTFIFGMVTAFAFLKTRTLWIPITIHATNNAVVWALAAVELMLVGEVPRTLDHLQTTWWVGLVGLLVGIPLLMWTLRRIPGPDAEAHGLTVSGVTV